MCKETKRKIARIKTKAGIMTEGAKQGFEIMLDEITKVHTEVNSLTTQVQNQNHRLEVMEKATAQTLEMVNKINDKLEVDKVEQKAAIVDAFQKLASSTFGKIIIAVFLVAIGLAIAYAVEHATGIAAVATAIK